MKIILYLLFLVLSGCVAIDEKTRETNYKLGKVALVGGSSIYEEKDCFGNVVKVQEFSQIGVKF